MVFTYLQCVVTSVVIMLVAVAVVSFFVGLYRCYKFIEDIHDKLCN